MKVTLTYCDSKHHGGKRVSAVYSGRLGLGEYERDAAGESVEKSVSFDACKEHLDQLLASIERQTNKGIGNGVVKQALAASGLL